MTVDRDAYLSFLEIQIEKVAQACLTVQGFEQKLNELSN